MAAQVLTHIGAFALPELLRGNWRRGWDTFTTNPDPTNSRATRRPATRNVVAACGSRQAIIWELDQEFDSLFLRRTHGATAGLGR